MGQEALVWLPGVRDSHCWKKSDRALICCLMRLNFFFFQIEEEVEFDGVSKEIK